MDRLPLVAIVGAPNVGKSTLFNRLIGRRKSLVTDQPGVTRDRIYDVVRSVPRPFRLVDTGGLTPGAPEVPFAREILAQAAEALREAALVLFVVDARAGVTALDRDVLSLLRRKGLSLVLVANKLDTDSLHSLAVDLAELGLDEAVPVSSEHGIGVEGLLDVIAEKLSHLPEGSEAEAGEGSRGPIKVAVVGRPNVGKSSLVNRLIGEDRVVVSEVPGTTRDAVDTLLEREGRRYLLVDTAGIRRKGRVDRGIEALSVMRARKTIAIADVVVLVLDASEGIAAQDTHIAGYAADEAKPVVVAVNKWDLVASREEAAKAWEQDIRSRLRFMKEVPVVFLSTKTGQRVTRVLDEVDRLDVCASIRVSTPELNQWLHREAEMERGAPAAGRSVRLFYATQTGSRPPRFVMFCNDARRVHFSLRRHLENSLRERFGFGPAPLRITFRSRREREAP